MAKNGIRVVCGMCKRGTQNRSLQRHHGQMVDNLLRGLDLSAGTGEPLIFSNPGSGIITAVLWGNDSTSWL